MKHILFLYSGEGTHSLDIRLTLLKSSGQWDRIGNILREKFNLDLETLWQKELGKHQCPYSPLLTVIAQVCLSDIWMTWGYRPTVVLGHSTGELAASYAAGLYTLDEVLEIAYRIGQAASSLTGKMVHGWVPDAEIDRVPGYISSVNFRENGRTHITVSGYEKDINAFLTDHDDFATMKLPHPWHHPDYQAHAGPLDQLPRSAQITGDTFVSGITTSFETRLADDYWKRWLTSSVDFVKSLETIKERYGEDGLDIIEIGFHPVLSAAKGIFSDAVYVSSMFRGEDDIKWILFQRKKLDQDRFLEKVRDVVHALKPGLDFNESLAYQGLTSLEFTQLADALQPYFPTLAPQDFYRYKTISQLIDAFGRDSAVQMPAMQMQGKRDVAIIGMSCRFPASVETVDQFWDMLISRKDQVRKTAGRGGDEAGFLDERLTRFDHSYFNISKKESATMDPQQILCLELTELLFRDAEIDPATLDKKRIGVYLGAWSESFHGDRSSVYYPTGINPSIIANRISNHYDFRGPSFVINTACSSSFLAVHYAAKDIEAGRVDFAIAGGVNMLLDQSFSDNLRHSGFLSRDNRCKTFDESANGYVRAEGGGLVLLAEKSMKDTYYALLKGSSTNQNGGRSQILTAPHPEAQEEVIVSACQDAGIQPQEISYIETHGTGTKIGDPIEISAIKNTVAKNRNDTCYIGSVKSNLGHLESAAGIAGLLKAVVALHKGILPPNLHFNTPNPYLGLESSALQVVTEEIPIDHEAFIGISSFGFGGSNAHVVIQGVSDDVRKEIRAIDIPFDRDASPPLSGYLKMEEAETPQTDADVLPAKESVQEKNVRQLIETLHSELTGITGIDPDIELMEQGIDSMSATELLTQLSETYGIDIEPDVFFEHPLLDQFVQAIEALVAEKHGGN